MAADNLVDEAEAAKRLCFSKSKLQKLRYSGGGPRYVKLGQHVRYNPLDLDKFIEANTLGERNHGS